jgi:hypothetical protein
LVRPRVSLRMYGVTDAPLDHFLEQFAIIPASV